MALPKDVRTEWIPRDDDGRILIDLSGTAAYDEDVTRDFQAAQGIARGADGAILLKVTALPASVVDRDEAVLKGAAKNVLTGKIEQNGGFTNGYDTDNWIAGRIRENPTNNSQGQYIQHRVRGDLGGLVHDASAAELRLSNASNTGAGQSAFEASLVLTGGESNDIGGISAVLANFHTAPDTTMAGSIQAVHLVRATQIPPLASGVTVTKAYSARFDQQIVGAENWTVYAPGGNSAFGPLLPIDSTGAAVTARGRSDTAVGTALLRVQNSTPTTLFQVTVSGTGGIGGVLANASWWANNNNATGSTRALALRAHPSQTANIMEAQQSGGSVLSGLDRGGRWFTAVASAPADADLAAGQAAWYFDPTNGSAKVKFKAKQADGTTVVGEVALA